MTEADDLRDMEATFAALGHLAGYAGALRQRADEDALTAIALENLASEGALDMSVADILKQAAADARASAQAGKASSDAVKTAIDSALARLSDNTTLTAEDVAAIQADLAAAKTANEEGVAADAAALAGADTIDPTAPGGVIVDPADPAEVVEG